MARASMATFMLISVVLASCSAEVEKTVSNQVTRVVGPVKVTPQAATSPANKETPETPLSNQVKNQSTSEDVSPRDKLRSELDPNNLAPNADVVRVCMDFLSFVDGNSSDVSEDIFGIPFLLDGRETLKSTEELQRFRKSLASKRENRIHQHASVSVVGVNLIQPTASEALSVVWLGESIGNTRFRAVWTHAAKDPKSWVVRLTLAKNRGGTVALEDVIMAVSLPSPESHRAKIIGFAD